MFFDYYYLILVVPALLIATWAQIRVKSTYQKYNAFYNSRNLTANEAARMILDANGLYDVAIQRVAGELSDHYDPRENVVRLSDSTYSSTSVGAIGVAAHEVGHAVQHATGYFPIKIRSAIIPITNFGSKLSIPLILLGFIFQYGILVDIGLILFSTLTVFQLLTLPVEFNASSRAMKTLEQMNILYGEELDGARKVLGAAAMTYVAALFVSLMQLLRLVLIFGRRGRDD